MILKNVNQIIVIIIIKRKNHMTIRLHLNVGDATDTTMHPTKIVILEITQISTNQKKVSKILRLGKSIL